MQPSTSCRRGTTASWAPSAQELLDRGLEDAALKEDTAEVRRLCALGARDREDLYSADTGHREEGAAVLTYCVDNDLRSSVLALLRHYPYTPGQLGSAMGYAAMDTRLSVLRMLLAAGASMLDEDGRCIAMYNAAEAGQEQALKVLLDAGADVNLPMEIDVAAPPGHPGLCSVETTETVLLAAATNGRKRAVAMLLDAGAAIDCKTSADDRTALGGAAAKRRTGVVRLLLARGADARLVDTSLVRDPAILRILQARGGGR
jgi:hypothetical protein